MKRVLLFLFLLLFAFEVYPQNNFTIVYNDLYKVISFEKQKMIDDFNRKQYLYINGDSVGFYSFGLQKPDKKNNTVGSKGDHHSIFVFQHLQRSLHENHWKKPYGLQELSLPAYDWKFHTDTMRIAGYLCNVAVVGGIVAWYTKDIPSSFGPLTYHGLPGLILMLEDHITKRLFKAVSVSFEAPRIVLPDLKLNECRGCESKLKEIEKYFDR